MPAVNLKGIRDLLGGLTPKSEADVVAELRGKSDAELGALLEEHVIVGITRDSFAYLVLFEVARRLRGGR